MPSLGIEKKERWASFNCWNGAPFDLTAYLVAVFGEGRCIYEPQAAKR